MKKLGRKLVLSSLSLGLAVVTLSTTTFAWYTANTKVSATGATGATAGATDSTLLISSTETGTFGVTAAATKSSTIDGSAMLPLQLVNGALTQKDGTTPAGATNYLQFTFYVKTTKEGVSSTSKLPVYLKTIEITNTTETALPKYDVLKTHASFGSATSYQVNAKRALSFAFGSFATDTVEYSYSNLYTADTGLAESGLVAPAGTDVTSSSVDALDYYNAVMGEKPSKPANGYTAPKELTTTMTANNANAIQVIELESNAATLVTVNVWLDGWDQYCFDGCQKQNFSISLELTTEKTKTEVGTI